MAEWTVVGDGDLKQGPELEGWDCRLWGATVNILKRVMKHYSCVGLFSS